MTWVWVLVLFSTIAAGGVFLVTLSSAKSAPQEAAGMAIAVALAVIPYVFARSLEGIRHADDRPERQNPSAHSTEQRPTEPKDYPDKPIVYEIK